MDISVLKKTKLVGFTAQKNVGSKIQIGGEVEFLMD